MSRITAIDSMRGVAASTVVFHHTFVFFPDVYRRLMNNWLWVYDVLGQISSLNVEAVLLFFVISGFSIRLSSSKLHFNSNSDRNFYLYKRFKRLLPLYWFSLALALFVGLLLGKLGQDFLSVQTLIGNLFFLQSPKSIPGNWFIPYGENYPLWSLSFEMFFYLLFLWFGRFQWQRGLKPHVFAIAVTVVGLIVQQIAPNPISLFASHFLIWYIGVELAEIHLSHKRARIDWRVMGLYAGIFLALQIILHFKTSQTLSSTAFALIVFFLWTFMTSVKGVFRSFLRIIDNVIYKLFGFLGLISYGLYLVHYPVLSFLSESSYMPPGASLLTAVLISVLLSYLAEKMFLSAKYNFLKRNYFPVKQIAETQH